MLLYEKEYAGLESKIATGLMDIIHGEFKRKVEFMKQKYALRDPPQMVAGREILSASQFVCRASTGLLGGQLELAAPLEQQNMSCPRLFSRRSHHVASTSSSVKPVGGID